MNRPEVPLKVRRAGAVVLLTGLMMLGAAVQGHAFGVDLSEEVRLDLDTSLTYSAAWRAKDADPDQLDIGAGFSAFPNGDDGNRAFKKGDMVNNRFTALVDLDLQWRDYGVFARGNAFYDFVYMGKSSWNDDPALNNNHVSNGGELDDPDEFTDATKDQHGANAELMDIFFYGSGDIANSPFSFRVGRQVVSWGESLFLAGGISSAQSPLDFSKANVPGVELKDIFLPVGQVSAQFTLFDDFTFAGYWGWEWEPTRLDEAGSFFSATDSLEEAGTVFLAAPGGPGIDRVADDDPTEEGQWGVSFRYMAEWLNSSEFGLYYINYHETVPMLNLIDFTGGTPSPTMAMLDSLNPGAGWGNLPIDLDGDGVPDTNLGAVDPATAGLYNALDMSSYNLGYAEDVRMLGASFSTVVGDHNVSGEVSFRDNLPVPVIDPTELIKNLGWEEANVLQAQISTFSIFGDNLISEGIVLATEVGFSRVNGYKNEELFFDKFAWGGAVKAQFDYYGVFLSGLDLSVPITYKFNPNGVSSTYLGLLFHEHADSVAISFDFTYNQVWKVGVGYTEFIGNYKDNSKNDRDFVSFNLKRTF